MRGVAPALETDIVAEPDLALFELVGADPRVRFSPNCWRIRLALDHKGLPFRSIAWHFTEKDRIAHSGQGKVPVLVDGDQVLHESWDIACHLERTYPDRPSLFGADGIQGLARFFNQWVSEMLHPALGRVLIPDIAEMVDACDEAYFIESREKALGQPLDAVRADEAASLERLTATLQPLRSTLRAQPYVSGEQPLYADFIAFSAFQWARTCRARPLLAEDDPVRNWLRRMDHAYPQAATAPGVHYAF